MATDVERLVVSLEASITKYERAMSKALQVSNKNMRDIERRTDQTMSRVESRMSRMGRQTSAVFAGVQRAWVGAFAGAAALRGAQQLIDASTRIENGLKVAGLAGEELESVYDSLFASAQRNAAPIEALTELYGRAALVQRELGVSTEELLGFTDNIAVALRVSGKSAAESSGALLQLSQALGSGIVRAEEFNSILEGALPIAQAAAAGLEEAGGSVAKLRSLVVDGKVSSEAFFRAFEAGSVILTEKVANAELTVSQQFIRLQNVLIDTAGKFSDATGASDLMGAAIGRLASDIEGFGRFLDEHGETVRSFFQIIVDGLEAIDEHGGFFSDLMGRGEWNAFGYISNVFEGIAEAGERASQSTSEAAAEIEFLNGRVAEATQAAANYVDILLQSRNADMYPPELQAQLEGIKQDLEDGTLEAADALAALNALGDANPNFAPLISGLTQVISTLQSIQSAAAAAMDAAALASAIPGTPSSRGRPGKAPGSSPNGAPVPPPRPEGLGVAPQTVSLADYPITGGGSGTSGGGRGGGSSQADAYQRALEQQRERLRMLAMEAILTRQSTVATDDYGYAVERLRTQMELENAAIEAGLAITPQRRAEIDMLADSYALAMANAEAMAQAQQLAEQAMDDLGQAGRSALDSIIDGFMEGKDAAEIFNSVLTDLAKNLINIGLNQLTGGLQAGGFNPLGFLGGMLGFATGTANTGGRRGEPRGIVHGQEAVIPLPNGGKVPVEMRMPSMPQAGGGQMKIMVGVSADSAGNLTPFVESVVQAGIGRAAPLIVGTSVSQANKSAPAAVAQHQQQRAGSDFRLM